MENPLLLQAKITELQNKNLDLINENNKLRELFEDALTHGFEHWIMDKARELGFDS